MTEFKIPELGENVASGDVTRVLVNVGDKVEREQPVVELETDKATIEVPSSVAGVVKEVKVKAGDKVKVGSVVLVLDDGASGNGQGRAQQEAPAEEGEAPRETKRDAARPEEPPRAQRPQEQQRAGAEDEQEETEPEQEPEPPREPRGKKPEKVVSMPRAAQAKPAEQPKAQEAQGRGGQPAPREGASPREVAVSRDAAARVAPAPRGAGEQVAPASPSVRRLAREIGVDVNEVQGSGAEGRITQEDVKEHARRILSSMPSGLGARSGGAAAPEIGEPLPDFTKWGEVERQPFTNIRRKTAEHLSHAWRVIPHVTQFDKADITAMEELRKKYRDQVAQAGGNLTVTAMLVKVLATAVKQFPQFNASLDTQAGEIVYKKYVNIGVAVDTDRGLLVPVVRNADQKNITQIAVDVHQLAEKARARKLTLEEMSGGGMSISNLGGIGGTYFTPIVNWPEVAILGVSRGIVEAVHKNGSFEPRQLLPLSLSYDHRVIDGADAMRFLRWVVEAVEQPFLLSLLG